MTRPFTWYHNFLPCDLDLLMKNFNLGCYKLMVAARRALLSSDNSYCMTQYICYLLFQDVLCRRLTCIHLQLKPSLLEEARCSSVGLWVEILLPPSLGLGILFKSFASWKRPFPNYFNGLSKFWLDVPIVRHVKSKFGTVVSGNLKKDY